MIVKVCQFQANRNNGERLVQVFQPGQIDEAARFFSGMRKEAAALLPDVRHYLEKLRPHPRKVYVLVNALGAGEYWGSNINGDYFPEPALIHAGPEFGYKTFYNAHPYKHHVNKDPSKSFGDVELVVWHDGMKRVELVIAVDRDRAKEFGAEDVCDKLDRGLFPDVSMGCFMGDTRVTMADGIRRPISEVVVGDWVLTHKGRARRVTAVHRRQYAGDFFSIKAEAHQIVRCTHRHPWWAVPEEQVKYRDDHANLRWHAHAVLAPDWVHAECLSDEYLIEPIRSLDVPKQWAEQQISEPKYDRAKARLLGYYLAEGHILRDKKGEISGIELTTHKDDPVHDEINQLCEEFGTDNPPSPHPRANSENSVGIYIFDKRLANMCIQLAGVYSQEKRLHQSVMYWPAQLISEMLGAYANGDGCSYEGSLKFSTASEDLAWQVAGLLPRLGILPSVSLIHHKAGCGYSSEDTFEWVVHVGKQQAPFLASYCQKLVPFEVYKAKNSRMIYGNNIATPIREIEAMYVETEVWNLEVEEDESYQVEGLAVHNCKVPYDCCSVCTDWDKYHRAQATFDPSQHASVGKAVLAFHRRDPIRGVSVTRNDYCEHLRLLLNKILSDGRKVYAVNDYPRFFDISFVFIGADKTAKVMAKLANARLFTVVPSWQVAEEMGYQQPDTAKAFEKVAQITVGKAVALTGREIGEELLEQYSMGRLKLPERFSPKHLLAPAQPPKEEKTAGVEAVRAILREKRASHRKGAEITKEIIPSQFGGRAVPAKPPEDDLPNNVLDALGSCPLHSALSTPSHMGMLLKPREFQRIIVIRMGRKSLADELDRDGKVFPPSDGHDDSMGFGAGDFSSKLMKMLLPFLGERSHFEPVVKRRIIRISAHPVEKHDQEDHDLGHFVESDPLLNKISAAYNSYLDQMVKCAAAADLVVESNAELWSAIHDVEAAEAFTKTAELHGKALLGVIGGAYLLSSYARAKIRKSQAGQADPPGVIMQVLADHPHIAAVLTGLGAAHLMGSELPAKMVSTGVAVVKSAVESLSKAR